MIALLIVLFVVSLCVWLFVRRLRKVRGRWTKRTEAETQNKQEFQQQKEAAKEAWFHERELQRQKLEILYASCPTNECTDYNIQNDDYCRGSKKETDYRKKYEEILRQTFQNKCVKCGQMTDLAIDHFFMPKNYGGCFVMETKTGKKLNNAILLCQGCNSSKSDNNFKDFFTAEELEQILILNAIMNKKVNE